MTTRHLVTVSPETEIDEIADTFARERFKKLPVVNERNEVVGVRDQPWGSNQAYCLEHVSIVTVPWQQQSSP
ncbi:MAG: CBS domain-containing protein [Bacilli bacterium]